MSAQLGDRVRITAGYAANCEGEVVGVTLSGTHATVKVELQPPFSPSYWSGPIEDLQRVAG